MINPNSSAGVTARIAAAARAAALPGDAFKVISAEGAPELIVTPEDTAQAVGAVLAAAKQHVAGMDGIVLASFGDTGLAELRARVDVPVVGIARAALSAAAALGERFAMVTFAPAMVPSLHQIIAETGHGARLSELLAVEGAQWTNPGTIQDQLFEPLRALCHKAARAPGVGCVVLGGGPLAGLAARLQPGLSVPVICGTTAALSLLRLVARQSQTERDLSPT